MSEKQTMDVPGYETLRDILTRAYHQAATGKGAVRHADAKPFHQQPMQRIGAVRGVGFLLGQADKKSEEAQGMLDRGDVDACVAELLGAINYLAGSVLFIERKAEANRSMAASRQAPVTAVDGCPSGRMLFGHTLAGDSIPRHVAVAGILHG